MAAAKPGYHLSELAERFGLELRADHGRPIEGVGTLQDGTPNQVSFLANRAYAKALPTTKAGAVILGENDADQSPTACLIAPDPYLAFARIANLFDPRPAPQPGIHPSAVVSETAVIGDGASIGPNAVIGDGCRIGAGAAVGPCSVLEAHVSIGEACRLYANVTLGYGVSLGKRVIVHPGAVIGADGFGIAFAGDHWEKVPQLGSVEIGDDCEIGANTCIDRGAIGNTVLEEDVRLDNLVQIAHNVHIGAHTAMAGRTGIAGSTKIGKYCLFAGASGASGHLEIADRTTVAATSAVFRSITEPGTTWSAQIPARPIREWQKNVARLQSLDDLARTVKRLEKQLEKKNDNE